MLWNGEPVLVQEELRSLVACKRLAWKADRATLSNPVKPRPGPNGMTILSATLWMSSTLHLRIEARHLCTCFVSPSTASFVEVEWDVLRVYVRELLLTWRSRRSAI